MALTCLARQLEPILRPVWGLKEVRRGCTVRGAIGKRPVGRFGCRVSAVCSMTQLEKTKSRNLGLRTTFGHEY